MEILELKKYIDNVHENLSALKTAPAEERQVLLYESYADLLDLSSNVKSILRGMRTNFKIRESEVVKWMKEEDTEEKEEVAVVAPVVEVVASVVEKKEEEKKSKKIIPQKKLEFKKPISS